MKCSKCHSEVSTADSRCPKCGHGLLQSRSEEQTGNVTAGGGVTIGDVGMIKDSQVSNTTNVYKNEYRGAPSVGGDLKIIIGQGEQSPLTRKGEHCPICGFVVKEEYFRCKKCGGNYLCLNHYISEYNMCSRCVDTIKEKEVSGREEVQELKRRISDDPATSTDELIKKAISAKPVNGNESAKELSGALNKAAEELVYGGQSITEQIKQAKEITMDAETGLPGIQEQNLSQDRMRHQNLRMAIIVGGVLGVLFCFVILGYNAFIAHKDTPVLKDAPSVVNVMPKKNFAEVPLTREGKAGGKVQANTEDATKRTDSIISHSAGQRIDRLSEFKSVVNQDVSILPTKVNLAVVIDSEKRTGISSENKLYGLFRDKKINVVTNLFKEGPFKSQGFFREIYDGNTDLLRQSDIVRRVDYVVLGRINHSFKKGMQLDNELVSCSITFNYKVISTKGGIADSDSLRVVGPGYSEEAALERGLEMLTEQYSGKILKSIL